MLSSSGQSASRILIEKTILQAADSILKTGGIGGIMLFTCLSLTYGWSNHYNFFLIVPLVCGGILLAAPEHRVNAALAGACIFVILYGTNLILVVNSSVNETYPLSHWQEMRRGPRHIQALSDAARSRGQEFDVRSRLNVMLDLRRTGVDAWPSISSSHLFKDWPRGRKTPIVELNGKPIVPLGGISNRTAVYCNEQGKYILLQNDEHGFANPGGSWKNQNPDLAVVGDSFAHGACVPSEQSVSALLRETYPTTLNLGNDGNGPLAELATLKEYLSVLKPKVLLWVYCETNDLTDLIQERRSLLINYLDPLYTQGLVLKQREIDDALMSYTELMAFGGTATIRLAGLLRGLFQVDNYNGRVEELIKLSYVWKLLAGIFKPTPESSVEQVTPSVSPQDLDLFKQIVKSAKDTVYDWGGKMIFVYLPQFERYAETGQANPHYQTVLSIVSELKIPIVDIVPVFWRQPDPLDLFPFRQPAHYTPEGYDIVAQEIRRFLQMEMPLQSSPPL